MSSVFPFVGDWFWWIVAAVLLFVELMAPGVFLVWLGLAAATVGAVAYFFDLAWQVEALLFSVFAVVYVYLSAPWYYKNKHIQSDQPNLNQRIYAFVGKNYVLAEPIVNGQGKLNIDGTRWDVLGPDLVTGTKIHVIAVEGMKLRVKEA